MTDPTRGEGAARKTGAGGATATGTPRAAERTADAARGTDHERSRERRVREQRAAATSADRHE